jgi:outer membrane immunogenic protein
MRFPFYAAIAAPMMLSSASFAADMSVAPQLNAQGLIYGWTGFYVGLNAGYAWGNGTMAVSTVPSFINTGALTPLEATAGLATALGATGTFHLGGDGFAAGGQFGYNYQLTDFFVLGAEADFQNLFASTSINVTNVTPRTPFFPPNTMVTSLALSKSIDNVGTVRARFGDLIGSRLLVYATGGFAYGQTKLNTNIFSSESPNMGSTNAASNGMYSEIRPGWTAGGGLEWALAPHWNIKAEYLYYDLGTATYNISQLTSNLNKTTTVNYIDSSAATARFNGNVARVGINYKFW